MVQFATIQKPRALQPTEKDINDIADLLFRRVQELGAKADTRRVVTSNPNGSISALAGTEIYFNDGGTFRLFVNTDGGTTWQEIT